MAVRRQDFEELVSKYDREFRGAPLRYRIRLCGIILLGYAFVCVALLLNLLILVGLIYYHITYGFRPWLLIAYAVFGYILWATFSSLMVRLPLPGGILLEPASFPWIHEKIKKLRKPLKLSRRRVHVLLTWDYNAGAVSRPMFGIIGPSKFYVQIGFPLAAVLSEPQFEAVLAHELVHLSRKHSTFFSWAARMHLSWSVLLEKLDKQRFTSWPFLLFVRWYWKFLEAAVAVLSRHQELEADRIAAEAVSKHAMGHALCRSQLRGSIIVEEYWRSLWRRALSIAEADPKAVSALILELQKNIEPSKARTEMRWALGAASELLDHHPSLSERLQNLMISVPETDAELDDFLINHGVSTPYGVHSALVSGAKSEGISLLDLVWKITNELPWRVAHAESQWVPRSLREIDEEWKKEGSISIEKAWKRARLTLQYYGPEKARPLLDYVLKREEDHPAANYAIGQILVREGDATGIVHLETAIEKEPLLYREAGLHFLADYYRRMHSYHDAHESKMKSYSAGDLADKAIRERNKRISFTNTFQTHDLMEKQVEELVDSLQSVTGVRKVLLVQKEVKHIPESPFYIIGIVPSLFSSLRPNKLGVSIEERIAFSRSHTICILGLRATLLKRQMRRVTRSVVFRRRWWKLKERENYYS